MFRNLFQSTIYRIMAVFAIFMFCFLLFGKVRGLGMWGTTVHKERGTHLRVFYHK